MWQNWRGSGDDTDRGVSPIVGITLLFGMVFVGAILVFVMGSAMFDTVGSEVDREKVHLCMGEADHRLGTVVATRTEQPMAFDDPDCQPEVVEEGALEITWFNSSDEDPDWDNESRTVSEDLGALKFELDDRTIAHQGGGIWERTDSGARVVKAPNVGFDGNETLQLDFMQLDSVEAAGSQSKAQHDYESGSSAVENLTSAVETSDGEDFALRIESRYAEAWERHLEREAEGVDKWNVSVTRKDDEVVMKVEDIGDVPADPHFLIDRDYGLTTHDEGYPHAIENNRVEQGDRFRINASLTNYGDTESDVEATISIWNESELVEERTIESKNEYDTGESVFTGEHEKWDNNHFFHVGSEGEHGIDLTPGEEYTYDVETGPGGDSLVERGTFLVVDEPPEFAIQNVDIDGPVTPRESLTVDARIKNQGEQHKQFVWLEGFDGNVVDIGELELDRNEQKTVTLEWGSVDVPAEPDEAEITVGTETDSETVDVDIDPLLEVSDIEVLDDPVEEGDPVTVRADIEAIGGETEQDVVLEGFDGTEVDRRSVTVSGSETVTLQYDDVGEPTGRVTVRTDDDEMEEVVVVDRDGPVCGAVSYDGSGTGSDPYQVSTVDELQCIDDQGLDAHYELVDDIDAHGTEYWNDGAGFEPIGDQWFWGNEFAGDFDGNGHAIKGLHIHRPDENFVGLFAINEYFDDSGPGVGEGSKIHDLRLENVSVHGQQVTGGLIGAAGGVIENVRVSGEVTAEYQEVGGIAGSAHNADLDNRLVSEATVKGGVPAAATHEVYHPWGADNMGIGGIVGSTGYNTEVSTAYSLADVEGPFAVGGIVGWTSDFASDNEQMYWAEGDIELTADPWEIEDYLNWMGRPVHSADNTGGAIFGRGDDANDGFDDSVYYNVDDHESAFGEHVIGEQIDVTGRHTHEMQGLNATDPGKLGNLHYEEDGGPWVAIPDTYPRFAWELEAEGVFEVEIDDIEEDVTAGETATIDVTVTSRYQDRDEESVTQTITLTNPDGQIVDTEQVTLESSLDEDDEKEISLVWQTDFGDDGVGNVTVRSDDREDSAQIEIDSIDDRTGESDSSVDDIVGGDSEIDIDVDAVEVS
ncbi:hypothetical protein ACFO5R_11615 [Halosolutus amylolyticus]|uniref:Uncharacterized protein n=1 Tax=Halosolutus amylolyticus TaxID=2932267 RepID=A0ABD5PRK1_9EURY|nr:hypothetical protein [Halosolutus amylolyticus]